jgi:hypothetical protein
MSEVASSSTIRSRFATGVLLILLVAAVAYSFHERNVARRVAAQNNAVTTSLNTTQSQVQTLKAQLETLTAKQAEKPAPSHPANSWREKRPAISHRLRGDDPRWKQVQSRLDDQGKQIESTREDLANTRTELQGSIARTHDELVLLKKKGERNYYEFDLDKSGQFQHEGTVGVRLRKANTKHEYADLELMVDDFKLSKKHVNIYEPVTFYSGDNGRPVELVINSISKNHIHGYVSEPKYRNSELQAMAGNNDGNQRQRLQVPDTSEPDRN